MHNELQTAIESLYHIFAVYPFNPAMEGCPCCVSESDKKQLYSKPLRQLEVNDLHRYTYKAMTTWGEADNFKHYLPRILELMSTIDSWADIEIVASKLEHASYNNWSPQERTAVTDFLVAWWSHLIKNQSIFDIEVFLKMYTLVQTIDPLLDTWQITFSDNSFSSFVELVHEYYADLTGEKHHFKEMDHTATEKLICWIKNNAHYLEEGYFYYESTDKELASRISTALYIYERT